jgi:hypothetical protein
MRPVLPLAALMVAIHAMPAGASCMEWRLRRCHLPDIRGEDGEGSDDTTKASFVVDVACGWSGDHDADEFAESVRAIARRLDDGVLIDLPTIVTSEGGHDANGNSGWARLAVDLAPLAAGGDARYAVSVRLDIDSMLSPAEREQLVAAGCTRGDAVQFAVEVSAGVVSQGAHLVAPEP